MTNVAAIPVSPASPASPAAGRHDPRLRAWRDLFSSAAAAVLRDYQAAWNEPRLDDAGRASAAVGLVAGSPAHPRPVLPEDGLLARIVALTGLDAGSEAIVAVAWWSTVDPQVAVLLGCVHDDAGRRYPTLGALAIVFAAAGVDVPLVVETGHPLVAQGLCEPVPDAAAPVHLPPTTSALLAGDRAEPPASDRIPPRVGAVARRAAALIAQGGRVLVRCELADDRDLVCQAVAGLLGIPLATAVRSAPVATLLFRLRYELPAAVLSRADEPPDGCLLAAAGPDAAGPGRHVLDLGPPDLDEAQHA
ncbi:MAG: hypothetical protein M3066_03265, partial [Actinomycetota bacterium]|nr:hypothetical protein [Actinomycetota bacterium]